jgi:hypothetical protein
MSRLYWRLLITMAGSVACWTVRVVADDDRLGAGLSSVTRFAGRRYPRSSARPGFVTVAAVITLGVLLSLAVYTQQRRSGVHHKTRPERCRWNLMPGKPPR